MALSEREVLERLRDAVVALKDVRAQRDALLQQKSEPLAIIGMACRFPGDANTPESFFDLLVNGVDTISSIPPERWAIDSHIDGDPRLQGARWGAFVKNADLFDAAFFGISPREAERLDPQQRFVLELAWEAFERAGIVPGSLAGGNTGVFVGVLNTDYFLMNLSLPWEQHDAYSATGNGHCFPAGRLAYTFGLQGPAVSVDTACSSSLVASHLACQSLRSRECDIALVAGVNHMLHPLMSELIAKTGALAPDGRCKSFDALANGYVRGEGCGMLILKRLSDAQRNGDPIVAVIRGSAINQDGRSTGLTTPNVLAQEAMLGQALANAQLNAEDIGYIEAHGTGTPLGDPIEMDALRAIFGTKRANGSKCWIGTVKTNIGHLEAAAGVAGLMKAALALHQEKIPTNLHFNTLNPRISLQGTDMAIANSTVPWPRSDKPRRGGVSSFGMSGTNAHVILEEAPEPPKRTPPNQRSAYLLPLSAKTPEALSALIKSFADWLPKNTEIPIDDIVHTASIRRTHHECRLGIVARTHEEFNRALSTFSHEEPPPGTMIGTAKAQATPKVVFVFPGQGSQWLGMGRELMAEEPVFRATIEECDRLVKSESGFSIVEQLDADEAKSRLNEIDVIQPLLFAFEVALAALWQSLGIIPDFVVGHSMGEVAAAHVAGMLSLEDAVKIICRRSRIMRRLSGQGAMALVELPMAEAEVAVAHHAKQLSAAVSNGPRTTVLSGDPKALDEVLSDLEKRGVFCRRVKVDVASHSPQVDVLHDELRDALKDVQPRPGKIQMVSTVTNKSVHGEHLTAHYWWNNLRQPVRFFQVTQELIHEHSIVFVELSPHPILVAALDETIQHTAKGGLAVPSLVRQAPQRRILLESLGKIWTRGVRVDWNKVESGGNHVVTMPTYPWQRKRYWIETTEFKLAITTQQSAPKAIEKVPPKLVVDECLFTLEWQLSPLKESESAPNPPKGAWLIFMDSGRIGKNLLVRLRSRGADCIRVESGSSFTKHAANHYTIDFSNANDYAKLLEETLAVGDGCRGIIHLANLDGPTWDDTTVESLNDWQHRVFSSTLYLTQASVRQQRPSMPKLWLISQGAIATKSNEIVRSVAQSAMWGLGRTIMLEHPELKCTCIDLDGVLKFDAITTLVQQLESDEREEHIAFRNDGRYVGRFGRARLEDVERSNFELKPDASYLVTGGLGGLGLSVAKWMVDSGARHVALMGRKPPSEETRKTIREMESKGAKITVLQGDVSHPDDVLNALCLLGAEMPELRGVVHAAGLLDDRTLLEMTEANVRTVFAPKVFGAWNLHSLTCTQQLDFFVLYSSGASLIGSSGQSNYSAANAFLDALAHARRARELPAMSIQWGAFVDVGLAAKQENRGSRLEEYGLAGFSTADGIQALRQLLERPRPEVGFLRIDLSKWLDNFPELRSRSLWSKLAATVEPAKPEKSAPKTVLEGPAQEPDFLARITNAPPTNRTQMLEEHVRAHFAKVLRMEPGAIDPREKIHHYGVDSLMAIELRNRLQASLRVQFSVTEIWTHGSVAQLAAWLGTKLPDQAPEATAKSAAPVPAKSSPRLTQTSSEPGQWIVVHRPAPRAEMRLFCFPYAGGGASVYSSWSDKLPADIEVCAIEPPGRHARAHEPLLQSVEEMVAAIIPAMLPYLDRPFAMFGHCLGAIVMFEVARQLISKHQKVPLQLFASAAPSPHQYLVPNVAARPDEEFLDLLRAIGLAQKEVLEDADVVRTMLPMVRGDFAIASKYAYKPSAPIGVPITTFAADGDVFAPPRAVDGWRSETKGEVSKYSFKGGHYFLVPERDRMLRAILADMHYRYAFTRTMSQKLDSIVALHVAKSKNDIDVRLVCFPGIGENAGDFKDLSATLPARAELYAIEYPGHGTRRHELPLGRIRELALLVVESLPRLLDKPLVFLGRNLGALVMYEVALKLQKLGRKLPTEFIVIGAMAPQLHYFAPIDQEPDDSFSAAMALFGFDLKRMETEALRTLRANAAALTHYAGEVGTDLGIPICAIGGASDALVSAVAVSAWRTMTRAKFVFFEISEAGSTLQPSRDLIDIIRDQLQKQPSMRSRLGV